MTIAGHETTLNLITSAVRALVAHRDQLDLVRAGRASWDDVVDETLRWDAPVSYFPFRYPVRDLTPDGTVIPRGTPVPAGYSAAGRDPAVHGPDAGRFDVTRAARPGAVRNLSLGHGAHYCPGAPPGWRPPWRWSGCSAASPGSTSPWRRTTFRGMPVSSATAPGRCRCGWASEPATGKGDGGFRRPQDQPPLTP